MAEYEWTATADELIAARRRLAEGGAGNRDHAIVMAARENRLFVARPSWSALFWLGREGEP